jgi:NADPH-dependent 2,4-dienoyl-CoA reductase/sulfur reductase-like enzyme
VIVGSSLAGLRGIETLRERGYDGEILAISQEEEKPYDRPPLSKQFLRGDWGEERLSLRRDGFDDLDVDWRLGCSATKLLPRQKEILLSDGETLGYGGLFISTGNSPLRLPGSEGLEGVHSLRNLADARALGQGLREASSLIIVGAGFIGMEVAATARQLGLEVNVVEALPAPLLRATGDRIGAVVAERFREEGVKIHCGIAWKRFLGAQPVAGIELVDGTILEADRLLVGIGARPECAWLEGSGLETRDGILCDGRGATSLPDVVAAGDVARWWNPLRGEAIRYEHWSSAVAQSGVAARRLMHGPDAVEELAQVPYMWSDLFEMRLAIVGDPVGSDDFRVCCGNLDEERFLALFGREGRLVAAAGMKRSRQLNTCGEMIAAGKSFEEAVDSLS